MKKFLNTIKDQYLFAITIILALFLVDYYVIGSRTLRDSFLSNFFASLSVAIIFSLLLPWYLKYLKRPKLKIYFGGKRTEMYMLNSQDGGCEASLRLMIKNEGASSFSIVYCHMFTPTALIVEPRITNNICKVEVDTDRGLRRIYAYITQPLYPERAFIYPAELKLKLNKNDRTVLSDNEIKLYYCFSTELGMSPHTASETMNNIEDSLKFEKLDFITLKLPPIL